MEIVLIRHGKPKIDTSGKVDASDFGKWVSEYNLAGIDIEYKPTNEALERAEKCAIQLAELSKVHKSVLFVGHGTINWFIHKRLLRIGWSGPRMAGRKHWEFGVYT